MEVMRRLEQQTAEILNLMYDSVTNQDFDRVSHDVDSCPIPFPVIVLSL